MKEAAGVKCLLLSNTVKFLKIVSFLLEISFKIKGFYNWHDICYVKSAMDMDAVISKV